MLQEEEVASREVMPLTAHADIVDELIAVQDPDAYEEHAQYKAGPLSVSGQGTALAPGQHMEQGQDEAAVVELEEASAHWNLPAGEDLAQPAKIINGLRGHAGSSASPDIEAEEMEEDAELTARLEEEEAQRVAEQAELELEAEMLERARFADRAREFRQGFKRWKVYADSIKSVHAKLQPVLLRWRRKEFSRALASWSDYIQSWERTRELTLRALPLRATIETWRNDPSRMQSAGFAMLVSGVAWARERQENLAARLQAWPFNTEEESDDDGGYDPAWTPPALGTANDGGVRVQAQVSVACRPGEVSCGVSLALQVFGSVKVDTNAAEGVGSAAPGHSSDLSNFFFTELEEEVRKDGFRPAASVAMGLDSSASVSATGAEAARERGRAVMRRYRQATWFVRWYMHSCAVGPERAMMQRAACHLQRVAWLAAFRVWRDHRAQQHEDTHAALVAARIWQRVGLAKAFEAFKEWALVRKAQDEVLSHAVRRWQGSGLLHAMNQWRSATERSHTRGHGKGLLDMQAAIAFSRPRQLQKVALSFFEWALLSRNSADAKRLLGAQPPGLLMPPLSRPGNSGAAFWPLVKLTRAMPSWS